MELYIQPLFQELTVEQEGELIEVVEEYKHKAYAESSYVVWHSSYEDGIIHYPSDTGRGGFLRQLGLGDPVRFKAMFAAERNGANTEDELMRMLLETLRKYEDKLFYGKYHTPVE